MASSGSKLGRRQPEQPRVLWTDEGLVFEDCYAANVIIPERSTLH